MNKRNYLIEEIKENELISKKHKKAYKILNFAEHLLILTSTITECVSIFAFTSLVGLPVGISSSTAKLCVVTAGINKYKPIIKKKEKNMKNS